MRTAAVQKLEAQTVAGLSAFRSYRPLWVVAVVDLFVVGIIVLALAASWQRDYDKAAATLQSISHSMDDVLSWRVEKIDLALWNAVDEVERLAVAGMLSKDSLAQLGARMDERLPEALGLVVTDAEGNIIYASPKAVSRNFDISHREHFIRQRDNPQLGLFISQPFQGRMWPYPIMALSRRYDAPDGSFGGVVANSVPTDSFSKILSTADILGPKGLATLWDKKLGLVSHYPAGQLDLSVKPSPNLKRLIDEASSPVAYGHRRSDLGGTARIAFFRKLSRWPLFLSLGISERDVMSKWTEEAVTLGLLGGIILIISVCGGVVYTRYMNALGNSEKRYKALFDHMQAGLSLLEPVHDAKGQVKDFKVLQVNTAYCDIFRLEPEDIVGKTLRQASVYPHDASCDWMAAFVNVIETGEPERLEIYIHNPGLWLDVVVYRPDFGVIAVLGIDINERKVAQAKAQRLAKLYAALGQCNQAIVHSTSQKELFPLVCRAAVESGGMEGAWIGLVANGTEQVQPVASYGLDGLDLNSLKISRLEASPHGQGPTGRAIRGNAPFWSGHATTDTRLSPWHEKFRQMGYRSVGALPLRRRGKAVGNLTLYSKDERAFGADARELLGELAANVSFALDTFALEAERRLNEARINELAFYDQLTGLANRALLADCIRNSVKEGKKNGFYNALLFIDLDNFKTINDTLGHDYGDRLLKQVAQRLTSLVRVEDTVARFGGDEFVLLLKNVGDNSDIAQAKAEAFSKTVLKALGEAVVCNGATCKCTASVGVTMFGRYKVTVDEVLKQADMAMYRAKDSGRNTVRFFEPSMQVRVLEHLSLERDLAEALRLGQFSLYYQPQITGNNELVGVEALVRWHHPHRGLVMPAEFIPLAVESGMILQLGSWALATACAQLAKWEKQPELSHLTLSVNVSARQFHEFSFVDDVGDIIARTGVNADHLKLELTETELAENVQEVSAKMMELRAMGVRFSLDDFGTGYSSMAYLKRLPLEQLKIDRSFIHDLLSDPNDAAIAGTIIALAGSLGLHAIAEGVESCEQRDFLLSLGCNLFQGFLYSPPLTAQDLELFAAYPLAQPGGVTH